jgi:hypothetical protein
MGITLHCRHLKTQYAGLFSNLSVLQLTEEIININRYHSVGVLENKMTVVLDFETFKVLISNCFFAPQMDQIGHV